MAVVSDPVFVSCVLMAIVCARSRYSPFIARHPAVALSPGRGRSAKSGIPRVHKCLGMLWNLGKKVPGLEMLWKF